MAGINHNIDDEFGLPANFDSDYGMDESLANASFVVGVDIRGSTGSISQMEEKSFISPPHNILYTSDDVDKLIKMLTLWIDDRTVIVKMEEMYKQWKDLQKKR